MRVFPPIAAFAVSSMCSSALAHVWRSVVHERRDESSVHWTKTGRPAPETALVLRVGMTQSNLERANEFVNQVSHPASDKYGQHWTAQEVIKMFAPSKKAVSDTLNWLLQSGVDKNATRPSAGLNWIIVNSTVQQAETLLKTTYYTYENDEGVEVVACDDYSVPEDIQQHIDLILPTIQFETAHLPASGRKMQRRDSLKPKVNHLSFVPDTNSLDSCSSITTPACIQAHYGLPELVESVPGNSLGVVEFTPQCYNQTDLDGFFSVYAPNIPNGTSPVFAGIDGGFLSNGTGSGVRGESNLDLCYTMGLVYPQPVTLFQVGDADPVFPTTNNNFLDAIDGSYCTFEGGDDPVWDAIFPHDGSLPNEWLGPPDCGTQDPTLVITVSYGQSEGDRPVSYRTRECTEWMKLAMMGITVLFASGDSGVAGLDGRCRLPNGGLTPQGGGTGIFNPMFPGTCPYITSVAGSALPAGGQVGDQEVASNIFPSSGGFSNIFPLADYQADAVAAFYANHDPGYNSSHYNDTRQVQGYPDVSFFSQNFVTGLDGGFQVFTGTSASSPSFAVLITIINGLRLQAGKSPVGFVNPVFYSHPEMFNDIVEGNNPACGTEGFSAVPGWDPVTGLGAPDFEKMKDVFMSLP